MRPALVDVLLTAIVGAACAGRPAGEAGPRPMGADSVVLEADSAQVPHEAPRALPALLDPVPAPPLRRHVTVCAGGDVMLGSDLDSSWADRATARLGIRVPPLPDAIALASGLRPFVRDADFVLLNVEGAIGAGPTRRKCRPGSTSCYAFRQPPEAAVALRRVAPQAVVVGNVANNHAMDAGTEGFWETVRLLTDSGVLPTGADTLPTVAVSARGDTVAFLGFSTFQAGADARDLEAVARHVRRASERHGRVIVTMHMGAEGASAQRTPQETETFLGENRGNSVAFARTAVAAGADAVIGHGPHVMRAAEWIGTAFVAYSLGNLLTYGPFNLAEPLNRGGLLCLRVRGSGDVVRAELRSTQQTIPGLVRGDSSGRAAFLVDSLAKLDFPETGVVLQQGGRLVRARP